LATTPEEEKNEVFGVEYANNKSPYSRQNRQ